MLHERHTINDHFNQIGVNLSETIPNFAPISAINGYRARLDNHTVHNLVRLDPGVKLVEHDYHFMIHHNETFQYDHTSSHDTRSPIKGLSREKVVADKLWWRKHIIIYFELCSSVARFSLAAC